MNQSGSHSSSADTSRPPDPHQHVPLERVLGLFSMVAIVVGEVIGSGVFFKPAQVARDTGGYVGLILSLWVICGLVNLCGALAMSELSAMYPRAGGTYVFLRETYGLLWSFLWAWAEFWVIRTGAIAALAVYTAIALEGVWRDFGFESIEGYRSAIAIAAIALLGGINIIGTRWGGTVQNVATAIKVVFVAVLALLPFMALGSESFALGTLWPESVDRGLLAGLGTATAAIMWAYDGWGNATVVAEEVRNPEKVVPQSLILGVSLLIVLYTGANLAYHLTLTSEQIAAEVCPAIAVCAKLIPSFGAKLMQAMLLVSLFGALNGNILVGPRVLFAVSRDHHFLKPLAHVHTTVRTPAAAIAVMCGWAICLILLGGLSWNPEVPLYDLLTEWTIFGGSIFYFMAVAAVLVLRRTQPEHPRPYRTWGYPMVPLLFLAFYVFLLVGMYWARPLDRMIGLGLIALGVIPYYLLGGKRDYPDMSA